MESNQGVAGALVNIERFQLGLNYYRTYPGTIASITKDQIREVAEKYLDPAKMVIISAGVAS
jgi:zinc protease